YRQLCILMPLFHHSLLPLLLHQIAHAHFGSGIISIGRRGQAGIIQAVNGRRRIEFGRNYTSTYASTVVSIFGLQLQSILSCPEEKPSKRIEIRRSIPYLLKKAFLISLQESSLAVFIEPRKIRRQRCAFHPFDDFARMLQLVTVDLFDTDLLAQSMLVEQFCVTFETESAAFVRKTFEQIAERRFLSYLGGGAV